MAHMITTVFLLNKTRENKKETINILTATIVSAIARTNPNEN